VPAVVPRHGRDRDRPAPTIGVACPCALPAGTSGPSLPPLLAVVLPLGQLLGQVVDPPLALARVQLLEGLDRAGLENGRVGHVLVDGLLDEPQQFAQLVGGRGCPLGGRGALGVPCFLVSAVKCPPAGEGGP